MLQAIQKPISITTPLTRSKIKIFMNIQALCEYHHDKNLKKKSMVLGTVIKLTF